MKNCVVYIDYDNIKYSKYDKIMSSLFESSYNINIKIFINENDLNNLDPIIKIKNNIFLCSPAKNKKNSIDCHIMIECMDDIYSNKYDCHIIISNDTDFIPLAKRIKSENKKCFLCYDNEHNFNSYLNDIYDNTYNLSHLLKLENDKIKKELDIQKEKELTLKIQREKEEKENKQKEINRINEIKKIERLSQNKKNQLSPILEEIFNDNIIHISISQFQKKLDKKKINYKKDVYGNNIKYKKYLEKYMPNIYIIKKDDNIYLK
tara:strand:+ start:856 stop:1644 length:789 start_codon:yes stop_codon:yes gene_type:complete